MWRNLIIKCGQSFISFSPQIAVRNNNKNLRFLYCRAVLCNKEAPVVNDGDPDYIVPYRPQYEKRATIPSVVRVLEKQYFLSKEQIDRIFANETVFKACREKSLLEALNILNAEGVDKENFVEYPWLLTIDGKKLLDKIELLKSIKGFRDINDFVPFLRLSLYRLRSLVQSLNRESNSVENENRVYFLAAKLNVPPKIVTKYLAKRLFVLEMSLEMFKTNLENLIRYKVDSMNILKDLWGFRYSPKSVEFRLKRALLAKKGRIMPWMVRCPEPILQKSLQISLDGLKVLGNKSTAAEYVGERLGFSTEEAQGIMNRHPQVNTVRVTKIKEVLDYLLDEEKFTRYEVAQVPRILCHSLETTKERIEELKKYGCRPSSLVLVCRSKREYKKFLQQWRHNRSDAGDEQAHQTNDKLK